MDLQNVKVLIIFPFKVYRQNINLLYIDRISKINRLKKRFRGQNESLTKIYITFY